MGAPIELTTHDAPPGRVASHSLGGLNHMSQTLRRTAARASNVTAGLTVLDPLVAVTATIAVLDGTAWPVLVLAALTMVVAARAGDLQGPKLVLSVVEDLPRLALVSAVTTLTIAALGPFVGMPPVASLTEVLQAVLALFVGLVLVRTAVYVTGNALRRRGRVSHPVIIVGAGEVGARLARNLLERPQHGLVPVGIVDSADTDPVDLPVPLLGGLPDLERAMGEHGVDDVIFSFGAPPDTDVLAAVRASVQADHQVFVVPRFFELMGAERHRRTEFIRDVALFRVRRWAWRRTGSVLAKRVLDIVMALVGLVVAAPVLAASALALRIETGSGVIFRQTRVGQGGRHFTLYKFRTLRPLGPGESATNWSIDDDPRLGDVGRFLRRTGLDELPQLVNVLQGHMSMVGPRPERPHFVQEFSRSEEGYADRHRVRVGITGLAQVNHLRGDTSIAERVRFDNSYIENWSFWNDLKIIARTVPTVSRPQPKTTGDVMASLTAQGSSDAQDALEGATPDGGNASSDRTEIELSAVQR